MRALVVALMLMLCPRRAPSSLEPLADAMLAVTTEREELTLLIAIGWHENSLGVAGVPYGALACHCRGSGEEHYARWTLETLRRVRARCGNWGNALGWWHTGRCRPDAYVRREQRSWHQLTLAWPRVERRLREGATP